jgi:ABC-2 type transport system ATP-binding protein
MSKALSVRGLSKIYANGLQALKGLNLEVEEGDLFALLGYNGAGKTTLIGTITGLVNKTEGQIEVFGQNSDLDPAGTKRMIGVVPQEFNFNIFEKVQDIVVDQGGYFGIPRKEAITRAEEILRQLDLWDKRNSQARTLSGGMKRRLMIARALIHRPKLLILDEPTAGVDVELRRGMWDYLQKINTEGTTIILTTHYLEEAELLCRNVAIIKQGVIVKQGGMKELLSTLESQKYQLDIKSAGQNMHLPDKLQLDDFELSRIDEDTYEVDLRKNQNLSRLIFQLSQIGLEIDGMRAKENRLEELFIRILNQD